MSFGDTTPETEELQFQVYRKMPGERRLLLAFEISEFTRALAREGIRRDHPDWNDAQISRELLRLVFFPNLLPAGFR